MNGEERSLRDAVKNARSAFYKNKGKQKKQSRKEERKTKRLEKKAKHRASNSKKSEVAQATPKVEEKKKRKRKRKRKVVNTEKEVEKEEEEFDYARYAYEAANKQDEKIISLLGKKLKANKKSTDDLNLFQDDGLDYILEVCEPLGEDYNPDDSDEEYLAAKKNKSTLKKRKKTGKNIEEDNDETTDLSKKLLFDDKIHNKNKTVLFDEFEDEDENILAAGEITASDDGSENDENDDDLEENRIDELEDSGSDGNDDDDDDQNMEEVDEESTVKSKYIPPALRKSNTVDNDKEEINKERLKKQLKGLLNRLSGSTLHYVVNELEALYSNNSRNTVNDLLYNLIYDALIVNAVMAERFIMEYTVVIATLNATTGSEIGSYILQMLVEKFNELHQDDEQAYGEGKQCQNLITFICYFYLLKIVDSLLIYDIIRRLVKQFSEQDIEIVLQTLKVCGTEIRKDDPGALKDIILEIQAKAASSDFKDQSRVRFMLEMINALKNNNMRKIQNLDPVIMEDGRKFMKALLKGRDSPSSMKLKVSLEDLLNAKEKENNDNSSKYVRSSSEIKMKRFVKRIKEK